MIQSVFSALQEGFDIVSAAPRSSRLASRLFYAVFNRSSRSINKLTTEYFRVLSRRAINRTGSLSKTNPYRKAVYGSSGLRTTSLPFDISPAKSRRYTKDQLHDRQRNALDALILFTNSAEKLSLILTCALLFISVGSGIYTFAIYALGKKPIEGWTTTMILLSVSFTGVFLLFTIVIKYLALLIDLVFRKQKYLVESIEKIGT
jgi:dolichol-phosphate mannosyltransferase